MDFSKKPILGMIHLSGDKSVFLERAMEEIAIFEQEGVDGIIVENYHGDVDDMRKVLSQLNDYNGILGLNVLPNEYQVAFEMANEYKASFIQLDYIAGVYESFKSFKYITEQHYLEVKNQYPNIAVLGGVWPKYYQPIKGSNLNTDIEIGMKRAEAIVVTGQGTGKETPIDKVAQFKNTMDSFLNTIMLPDFKWNSDFIKATLDESYNNLGYAAKKVLPDLRLALTGGASGAHLQDVMVIIGKNESIKRINDLINIIKL